MYWDIGEILSYNRRFNFINGPRSIGKTYTTQKFCIKRAIERNEQFFYMVRTQYEKLNHAMYDGLAKVLEREFSNYDINVKNDVCVYNDGETKRIIGHCLAISESAKIRRKSFPLGKYLIFDEYMLAPEDSGGYVDGWKEPDKFLSIYHTIDREEDRVICFFLGNNTSFYNPGKIWCSKNVLFQYALPSPELAEEKGKSEFIKMIKGTEYSSYAISGSYTDTTHNDIEQLNKQCIHVFNIVYKGITYGAWRYDKGGSYILSKKHDPSCPFIYAISATDMGQNTILAKDRRNTHIQFVLRAFKYGKLRFDTQETRSILMPAIISML